MARGQYHLAAFDARDRLNHQCFIPAADRANGILEAERVELKVDDIATAPAWIAINEIGFAVGTE